MINKILINVPTGSIRSVKEKMSGGKFTTLKSYRRRAFL